MKYGKEFQSILDESSFPEDWKTSAIEYRRLKKLIKNVVAELEGMGLSHDVLQRLLVTDEGAAQSVHDSGSASDPDREDEVFEFEFDVNHAEQSKVQLNPVFDDDDETDVPAHPHRFRVRMLSEGDPGAASPPVGSPAPLSVSEMLLARGGDHLLAHSRDRSPSGSERRVVRAATDGVKAEYVLTGDEAHPVPQIRLHVSHLEPESELSTPRSGTTSLPTDTTDTDETDDDDDDSIIELSRAKVPPSPALLKMRSAASPIWALATTGNAHGMAPLSLDEAVDTTPKARPAILPPPQTMELTARAPQMNGHAIRAAAPSPPSPTDASPSEREFIIPLQSDVAFFNVLTAALTSLSNFHAQQQEQFHVDVERLTRMISSSIVPDSNLTILPSPLNSSPMDSQLVKYDYKPMAPKQKDLYAWREIFALWVESEIFESHAERDRGERTIDVAEKRLRAFANEVVRRGLGDRRTIKGKRSRKAWDEFLRLNVHLLDLKRFQMANIDAARKILKKHDKRTALTASTGLQAFVRGTIEAHVDKDGNVSTWTFYNTSLPHVLLARLTDALLPILPSLDDYACLICMSIAFKPIRLSCGHLFCVRCLVKMQQRSKENCPLCRAPTVLLADKGCLDTTLMSFMRDWFPREVKDKQRENTQEIAKETIEDAGMDSRCVVM